MNTCNHTTIESVAAAENGMCPLCLQAAWQEKDAQVAALQAALDAANKDAERLASVLEDDGYPVKRLPMDAKRLSLAAHRARVGGAA